MRTSIDFPDELFRSLKANAALQGTSLRDHVISLIERGRAAPASNPAAPAKPRPVPPIPSITIPGLVWPPGFLTTNADIHALQEEEDMQRHERLMQQLKRPPGLPKPV